MLCGTGDAGKGKDEKPLDEKTMARWRTQAVEWLKAGLAQSSKQAETGKPEDKSLVGQTLQDWKSNADLAGIREETVLKRLPDDDQKACRASGRRSMHCSKRLKAAEATPPSPLGTAP